MPKTLAVKFQSSNVWYFVLHNCYQATSIKEAYLGVRKKSMMKFFYENNGPNNVWQEPKCCSGYCYYFQYGW